MVSVYARRCTSLLGSCPLGRGTALATVTTPPIFQESVFLLPFFSFLGDKPYSFFRVWFFIVSLLLDMLVAGRERTPCYNDAYSSQGILGERLAETL